ncbi:hypothetical protein HMPREF9005_2024, partial [Actinomyces sp. oral taxon 178 str. F0338]
ARRRSSGRGRPGRSRQHCEDRCRGGAQWAHWRRIHRGGARFRAGGAVVRGSGGGGGGALSSGRGRARTRIRADRGGRTRIRAGRRGGARERGGTPHRPRCEAGGR